MARDCIGFGMCASCYQSMKVQVREVEFYLCAVNDRIQFRCANCNARSTAQISDVRLAKRLCKACSVEAGE